MTEYKTREERDFDLMLACAYGAVREHFSHLTIEDIINPPFPFADAYVARHMATCILCEEFELSRLCVSRLQMRVKSTVFYSLSQIHKRRAEPAFERVYRRVATKALKLYAAEAARMVA